ncbi:hypothetical protein Dda_8959 [Drechslerella dactyloides]|uniref:Uncharacterized protein n=1 Tax=Drechslerella dactyloides TaxID=74499 RepID=A0AAD6IQ70_DREDA|nr:hypothetical protein Dda_8959 [Drechslerella dactyloides]
MQSVEKADNPSQEGQMVSFKTGQDIDKLVAYVSADDGSQLPMTGWGLNFKSSSVKLSGM